ncbi:Ribonuclease H-like domain [Lasallia pustulata]|uniref:Ribonuclease H-like domain n=1 Tax=Lasallia pustulata TaxID=136370 RepID=A0A1W5CVI0_9LECA|nr:Ribonuclease H-like domain [Lasallia pustulata]
MEDFLMAVESKDPHFTSTYMMKLEDGEINDIYTLAERFRHRLRLKAIYQPNKSTTHTAFAAEATNTATASKLDASKLDASKSEASKLKASYKGNKKDKPDCLCGWKHFYNECYYLNETTRPLSWSPNAETQARVDEAMKEPKVKKFVEISLQHSRDFQAKKSNDNDNNKAREAHPSFSAAVSRGSYSTGTKTSIYDLLAEPGDTVASGTQVLPIHSYGTIIVSAKGPNGNITIELLDVVYVPEYLTNLVSMHRFAAKGIYHDARNSRLERDHITLCHIKEHSGHYLLEDNTTTLATIQSPTTQGTMKQSSSHAIVKTATPNQWHQVMAHTSAEAISHLETSAEGVKIKDKESSIKSDMSTKPFERITFDLMEFQLAYNRHKQVSHIACDFTDFNMVWTYTSKSDSRQILLDAVTNIKVQFNAQVIFIHTDNETSLDMEFQAELSAQGITIEISAPDTPAQNGHSERKGGILSTKARTMRVAAGLPTYLWPEIMCAAGYIANRTPMQKHRWKTPYELATGKKPNLQHLKAYGCKAYLLDKEIGQKHKIWKLTERAHIGHLLIREPFLELPLIIPPLQESSLYTDFGLDINSDEEERLNITPPLAILEVNPAGKGPNSHLIQQLPTPQPSIERSPQPSIERSPSPPERSPPPRESSPELDTIIVMPPNTSQSIIPFNLPAACTMVAPTTSVTPVTASIPSGSQEIVSTIDVDNIIGEGVKRTRRQRRQAYSAKIKKDSHTLSTFHNSFSMFTAAHVFYNNRRETSLTQETPHQHGPQEIPHQHGRLHRDTMPKEPDGYTEMLRHPHAEGFKQAMAVEITALKSKGTWREVSYNHVVAAGKIPIPTRWVYKNKYDEQGFFVKHKARLCAHGDLQKTLQDTFAVTLAALGAFDLETRQFDTVNAFANSPIDEPTYCKLPASWEGDQSLLLLLQQALYGLKQSPALWYRHLSATLTNLGLETVPGVQYLHTNQYMLVFFFVDDIAVIYDRKFTHQVNKFEKKLCRMFTITSISNTPNGISNTLNSILNTPNNTSNTLKRRVETPLPVEEFSKSTAQASAQDIYLYQQKIGSLNFAAVITRPDIAHATSTLSNFFKIPSPRHMELADRVLIYLAHTKEYAIEINPNSNTWKVFNASSDASYGNDPDTPCSTQGYVFTLFGGAIDWKASKQKTVTTSTTEAELLALSLTAKETLWWDRFFEAIGFKPGHQTTIKCDNQQTIRILTSDDPRLTTKL